MRLRRTRAVAVGAAALAAVLLAGLAGSATADTESRVATDEWRAAWGTAMQHPDPLPPWGEGNWSKAGFADESVRQIVRVGTGGSQVRIRLSNRYGTGPLQVTGATIAKTGEGAAVRPNTVRPLSFGHRPDVAVPAGGERASDPVALPVSPLESLTVTLYFAGSTGPATFHKFGLSTSYRASGDHRFDRDGSAFTDRTKSWYYLTGVEVTGESPGTGTVVAFGDSQTEGMASTPDTDNRYPDQLAERLVAEGTSRGVVNAGIGGNRLIGNSTCFGESGIARFERDVVRRPGVDTVVVLLGNNDIGLNGRQIPGCGEAPVVTAEQLIEGYRTLIRQAHDHGIKIIGVTLTPMKGNDTYWSPEKEAIRDAVNHWIRTGGEYDAVADFDAVVADPADPDAIDPEYDASDHVHLNDAGLDAVAAAIDLDDLR